MKKGGDNELHILLANTINSSEAYYQDNYYERKRTLLYTLQGRNTNNLKVYNW